MAALTLLFSMTFVMYRKCKVESLKGFRVFAKSENRDGQIKDLSAAPSSDNHQNNCEDFVIGHDHHLPLYREGKSQAPSVSFLPEAFRLHRYYSIAVRPLTTPANAEISTSVEVEISACCVIQTCRFRLHTSMYAPSSAILFPCLATFFSVWQSVDFVNILGLRRMSQTAIALQRK